MSISQDATISLSLIAKDLASGNIQKVATGLDSMSKKGSLVGTALKGAGVVAAGGFAVMTKGALEAEDAQGKFMAQTGATREEAKAFVSSMDGIAGSAGTVGKSFSDIADVGTQVQNQFGTTGQATADLTDQFFDFAKASGQDAKGAVLGLNDAMTAFGEPTQNAQGDMDLLIASHQKFGTDIGPQTIATLQNMGPAMTTLGGDFTDGIGLMNAFESAGVNSNTAMKDLQTSIKTMPPGTSLNDVITKLGAIEDPGKRAQAAVDLFGAKAGPALAKVIQPGMTSLDDFKVSADDAAGATVKAAQDMETLPEKLQGFADKAMAGARELGQQFGPAITGLASLSSLAAPFAKGIGGMLKDVALKVLPQATAAGVAEGEAQAAGATGPGVLRSFLARFGLMTGEKIVASEAAGTAEGLAEGEAAAAAATGPEALASAGKGGGALGGALGAAVGPAVAVAAAAGLAIAIDQIMQQAATDLRNKRDQLKIDLGADPLAAQQVQQSLGPWRGFMDITGQVMQTIPFLGPGMADVGRTIQGLGGDIDQAAGQLGTLNQAFRSSERETLPAFANSATASAQEWRDSLKTGMVAGVQTSTSAAADVFEHDSRSSLGIAAQEAAVTAAHAFTRGLYQSDGDVETAFKSFQDAMKHPMTVQKQLAELNGELTSKALQKGLKSNDPLIRQQAEDMRDQIQSRIDDLQGLLKKDGTDGGNGLATGLSNSTPGAVRAANTLTDRVNAALQKIITGIRINVNTSTGEQYGHGRGIPRYARGGHYDANTPRIVGENGIELDVPDNSGTIIPLDRLGSAGRSLGGGGDIHVHLSFNSAIPYSGSHMQSVVRELIPELTREMRRQGLLPSPGRSFALGGTG